MSEYRYTPLKDPSDIRLVHLHPQGIEPPSASSDSNKPSDIRISIKEAKIDRYPYSALSYVWGKGEDAIPSEPITVEGKDSKTIKITPSLHAALSNFEVLQPKVLWIDALCINQMDAEEKSVQVGRMATIYRKASDVIIWLGNSTQASDSAMNFIQEISVRELDRLARDPDKGDLWRALVELMRRPWFSRRWIIQEVAFAKNAELWCGSLAVSWAQFAEAVTLFESKIDDINTLFRALGDQEETRNKWERRFAQYVVPTAVAVGIATIATLSKGKLKISPPMAYRGSKSMTADIIGGALYYWQRQFPIGEVRGVGAHSLVTNLDRIIRKTGVLNEKLERLCSTETLLSLLPTFEAGEPRDVVFAIASLAKDRKGIVPDYKKSVAQVCKEAIEDSILDSGSLNIICRPWAPDVSLPSWITKVSQCSYQKTEGIYVRSHADPLVGPPDRCPYKACGASSRASVMFTEDEDQYILKAKGVCFETLRVLGSVAADGVIPSSWFASSPNKDMKDMYWRTLIGNRDGQGNLPDAWMRRACEELDIGRFSLDTVGLLRIPPKEQAENEVSDSTKRFLRRVQAVTWNRKIVKLRDGSFGLVPDKAVDGDIIAVLYGCDVPVVLRKSDSHMWEFIGEAYVHGIMDGEALQRGCSEQEFRIN